jgi:hypothetical protein
MNPIEKGKKKQLFNADKQKNVNLPRKHQILILKI